MKQVEKNSDKRVKSYPQFLFKKSKLAHIMKPIKHC